MPPAAPARASPSRRHRRRRVYHEVTGTRLPEESVEIVYGIFDADQDGALGMDEVLGMMTASGHIDARALRALADLPPDSEDYDDERVA